MSKTRITKTPQIRRFEAAERLSKGTQLQREHGPLSDKGPNYAGRRFAAGLTAGALLLGVGEATDYGDSVPVVAEIKEGASWVATQIDKGPSNPEVVNESWRSSQNVMTNLGIEIQSDLASTSRLDDNSYNQEP